MTNNFENIPVEHQMQTVAFYNVENLFDTTQSKTTNDTDFLPNAIRRWTPKRYNKKLHNLGFAISNIGRNETGKHPAIVGLAEVENAAVVKDLLNSKYLTDINYDFVHFNSLDERGIDVAMLYDTNVFKVLETKIFNVDLRQDDESSNYTRDILLVSGVLDNEEVHFIINHWSSRREGTEETKNKRLVSSTKVSTIIANLLKDNKDAKIIVMGDFNDTPQNESVKHLCINHNLYNPFETLKSFTRGTVKHKRQWYIFDQVLISTNFFRSSKTQFEFYKADIFDADFLKIFKGHYKGAPYRTYAGPKYKGGYSDHFPVYIILKK